MEINKDAPFQVGQRLICLNKYEWTSNLKDGWKSAKDADEGRKSLVPHYEEEVTCGKIEMSKDGWKMYFFEYGLKPRDAYFVYDKGGESLFKISDKISLDVYSIKDWLKLQTGIQFFVLKQEEDKILSVKRIMDGKEFKLHQHIISCNFDPDVFEKLKKRIMIDVSISRFFDDNINVELNYSFRLKKKRLEDSDEDILLNIHLTKKIQINEVGHMFSGTEYNFTSEYIESNIEMINIKILAAEKLLEAL